MYCNNCQAMFYDIMSLGVFYNEYCLVVYYNKTNQYIRKRRFRHFYMCVQVKILTFPVCRTYEKPYFPKIIRAFHQNYSVFFQKRTYKKCNYPVFVCTGMNKGPRNPGSLEKPRQTFTYKCSFRPVFRMPERFLCCRLHLY